MLVLFSLIVHTTAQYSGAGITSDVTLATLVAQFLYASLAWSGFIKSEEKAKLQYFMCTHSVDNLVSDVQVLSQFVSSDHKPLLIHFNNI